MIKTYSQMQNTLQNYKVDNWAKSTQVNNQFGLEKLGGGEALDGESKVHSFGQMLMESLAKVNDLQQEADVAMQKLASGESKNLHETLLAVEKADIAFRTMNQVRTKVIDAYKEIMRMQI